MRFWEAVEKAKENNWKWPITHSRSFVYYRLYESPDGELYLQPTNDLTKYIPIGRFPIFNDKWSLQEPRYELTIEQLRTLYASSGLNIQDWLAKVGIKDA